MKRKIIFSVILCFWMFGAKATISGPSSVCAGSTISLTTTSAPGGAWSSSDNTVATVNSSSGVVTGASAGSVTVTYTIGGVPETTTINVNPLPAPITGVLGACNNTTNTLSNASGGGTWSSSSTSYITIGSTSGIITGHLTGTSTITYSLLGCIATATAYSYLSSGAIPEGGSTNICLGGTSALTSDPTGGTWSSSNTAVATVGSTGLVSGITVGTPVPFITYSLGATCYRSVSVSVLAPPTALTGVTATCEGSTTTLFTTVSTGTVTYSSNNTGIATVTTHNSTQGYVVGVSAGTVTITCTRFTGCFATANVDVITSLPAITGPSSVCQGSTITLSDFGNGVWSTSNGTGSVSIGAGTGIVTGLTVGTATVTYALGDKAHGACYVSKTITIGNTYPSSITGTGSVCAGGTTTLSDGTGGGTWSSGNDGIATVVSNTGIVTGVVAGTVVISYTIGSGCSSTTNVTVNSNPTAITGTTSIAVGGISTLADAVGGGTWSSSNTGIATISSSTGIMTGVAPGTATITYALATGCYATTSISVDIAPNIGTSSVCVGFTTVLSNSTAGGTWYSANAAVATVNSSTGVVTGISAGTVDITYAYGGTFTAITNVTVNSNPAAIIGSGNVCVGATISLSDATSGGSWSSSNTAVATINSSTGVLTAISVLAGAYSTATITYSLNTGCYVTTTVTVDYSGFPLVIPDDANPDLHNMCLNTTHLQINRGAGDVTAYTWVSGNTAVATISTMGSIAAINTGTTVITFTATNTGCYSTYTLTVVPDVAAITGVVDPICTRAVVTLSDATAGGEWATTGADLTVSSTGVVTIGDHAATGYVGYWLYRSPQCLAKAFFEIVGCGRAANNATVGLGGIKSNIQQYSFLPNPGNGNMSIQQRIVNDEVVGAKVISCTGAVVYTDNISFKDGAGKLNLEKASPGMYFVVLHNNDGTTNTAKIVIQNN